MDKQSLAEYVIGRMKTGASKSVIKEELLSVGWSQAEADLAYRDALIGSGMPVPTKGSLGGLSTTSSTVDIVINFFSFILLGILVTALGSLFFAVIERYFPDTLDMTDVAGSSYAVSVRASAIHYAIAALIIAFPLYYAAMRIWFRKFREDEHRVESRLSKWLTYIVLLIASVTIVGDLIAVLFTFLEGEITARFFLKALTVLGLAGIVFGFYYLERRKIQYGKDIARPTFLLFGRGVAGIILVGIILGFFASGSPVTARKHAFDARRSGDLSTLSDCVRNYAGELGQLPLSLSDLKRSSTYSYCAGYMKDPETDAEYSYRIVTPSKIQGTAQVGEYELCATFSLPNDAVQSTMGGSESIWYTHVTGRVCNTVTAQLTLKQTVPGNAMVPLTPAVR